MSASDDHNSQWVREVTVAIVLFTVFFVTNRAEIRHALNSVMFAILWGAVGIGLGTAVAIVYFWSGGRIGDSQIPFRQRRIVFALIAIVIIIASSTILEGPSGTMILLGTSLVWATSIGLRALTQLGYLR